MLKSVLSFAVVAAVAGSLAAPAFAQDQAKPPLSPPGQTTAKIGAATLTIDYNRPSMRGRKIMGELVPFGKVWRTGANRATHLKTDAGIRIGTLAVPAGTYTIYTLPGEKAWTLIINKQIGQWGTQYDQAQDLGRVDLKVEALPAAVEQFTMTLSGTGNTGSLTLEWENTRASVAIEAK
jgi:hypothetical protein